MCQLHTLFAPTIKTAFKISLFLLRLANQLKSETLKINKEKGAWSLTFISHNWGNIKASKLRLFSCFTLNIIIMFVYLCILSNLNMIISMEDDGIKFIAYANMSTYWSITWSFWLFQDHHIFYPKFPLLFSIYLSNHSINLFYKLVWIISHFPLG